MATDVLRIGHGNGHNDRSLVDFVRTSGCDSFGGNELHRLIRPLNRIPGTRLIAVGKGATDRRARSTAIITRDEHADIGAGYRQVSENIPAHDKFAPDRFLVWSMFEHPLARLLGFEGVAHFALHPDATVMKRTNDHPLIREYRESMASTARFMKAARRDRLLLVLTMDAQVTARFKADWGPRAMIAQPLDLSARFVHIDAVFFDAALRLAKPLERRQLFDHTGFVSTFTANTTRKK